MPTMLVCQNILHLLQKDYPHPLFPTTFILSVQWCFAYFTDTFIFLWLDRNLKKTLRDGAVGSSSRKEKTAFSTSSKTALVTAPDLLPFHFCQSFQPGFCQFLPLAMTWKALKFQLIGQWMSNEVRWSFLRSLRKIVN